MELRIIFLCGGDNKCKFGGTPYIEDSLSMLLCMYVEPGMTIVLKAPEMRTPHYSGHAGTEAPSLRGGGGRVGASHDKQ